MSLVQPVLLDRRHSALGPESGDILKDTERHSLIVVVKLGGADNVENTNMLPQDR